MPVVLVIGDVMTDIVAKPDGPIAVGADRRALIRTLPGGAGANQACWLAAEKVEVRFAARVGREDHARQTADFAAYGVDARLGADAVQPTGALVTLVSPDGERSFLTDRAANLHLQAADLPHALPAAEIEERIVAAVKDAERAGVSQKAVTPYLLVRINELTGGKSLSANIALIKNNAALAAQIAIALADLPVEA